MSWFWGSRQKNDVSLDTIVERLCTQVYKPEERKSLILDLRDLAQNRDNHETIGKVIPTLIDILKERKNDTDLIRAAVEILGAVVKCPEDNSVTSSNYIELVNTEALVQTPDSTSTLLNLFESEDFYVRFNTIQLLSTLVANRKTQQLQENILTSPLGMSRLMDLLTDHREVIRNEGLLLLLELTKTNQEIQKIVAFQGAFERLLDMIKQEGFSDGSVVVADCLQLMNNLLRDNTSNQNYFRETGCVQKLPNLLQLQNSDLWFITDNKMIILVHALELISLLVSGNNPQVEDNQTVLAQSSALKRVIWLGIGRINAPAVRSQALRTLGDLIRNHPQNRDELSTCYLSSTDALVSNPTVDSVPALLRIVIIALNSTDFAERVAATFTFQCYTTDNPEGQLALASTLAPPPTSDQDQEEPTSIGRQLISAMLSVEAENNQNRVNYLQSWYATCLLSHILYGNNTCKESVLRVPLDFVSTPTKAPTLFSKAMDLLVSLTRSENSVIFVRVGLLRLLCVWLDDCSIAVNTFLQPANNIPFLVELVILPSCNVHIQGLCALAIGLCSYYNENESSRSSLQSILLHRIGIDKYIEKLDRLRKTSAFLDAEQDKFPTFRAENDTLDSSVEQFYYDYEFTLFFKDAYDKIIRQLRSGRARHQRIKSNPSIPVLPPSGQSVGSTPISPRPKSLSESQTEDKTSKEVANSSTIVVHSYLESVHESVLESYKELIRNQESQIAELKSQLQKMKLPSLEEEMEPLKQEIKSLKLQLEAQKAKQAQAPVSTSPPTELLSEVESLKEDNTLLKQMNEQLKTSNSQYQSNIAHLKQTVTQSQLLSSQLQSSLTQLKRDHEIVSKKNADLEIEIARLSRALKEQQEKYASLEQEQEELLVCLAKEEMEKNNLKGRLSLLTS